MKKYMLPFVGFLLGLAIVTPHAQPNIRAYQPWASSATLLVADTTKLIQAAPGTNAQLFVRDVSCSILTAAAQVVNVESTDGVKIVLRIPASATVPHMVNMDLGMLLPLNNGLRIQPAAAGPSVFCIAEGTVRGIQ